MPNISDPKYHNADKAREHLEKLHWPHGPVCPHCGVINEATLALHPGFTAVTGETGAGKTMIVTGMGLLLGGRIDAKAVRAGAERARVEGRFSGVGGDLAERVGESGGELDDDERCHMRQHPAVGRQQPAVEFGQDRLAGDR